MTNFVIIALIVLIVVALCTMCIVAVIVRCKNKQRSNSKRDRKVIQIKSDSIDCNRTLTILKASKNALNATDFKITNSETRTSPISSAILRSSDDKNSVSENGQIEISTPKRKPKVHAEARAPEASSENFMDYGYKELLETILKNTGRKEKHKIPKIYKRIALCLVLFVIACIFNLWWIPLTLGCLLLGIGLLMIFLGNMGTGIKCLLVGCLMLYLLNLLIGVLPFAGGE